MDPNSILTIGASIAGIFGALYVALVGQRTLPEIMAQGRKRREDGARRSAQVLHNLPQIDADGFVGRGQQIRKLFELLAPTSRHFLISIEGFSGVGKSELALYVANSLARSSEPTGFDAVVWVSAKTAVLTADGVHNRESAQLTLESVLSTICIVMGPPQFAPVEPAWQTEMVRRIFSAKKVLLVVDNYESVTDTALFAFLREIPAPSKVLITSRHRVDSSYSVTLQPLSIDDARILMNKQCESRSVRLSEEQQLSLYSVTGGVPIAINWSIARMAFGFSPNTLIRNLASHKATEALIPFCFTGVLELTRGRDEYLILLALALFEAPADVNTIARIVGWASDPDRIERALVRLGYLSLTTQANRQKVGIVHLARVFARGELGNSEFNHAFRERFVAHYVEWLSPSSGNAPAEADIIDELENIKQAIRLADELMLVEGAFGIILSISRVLYTRGLYTMALGYWDRIIQLIPLAEDLELFRRAAFVFANGVMYGYTRNNRAQEAFDFLCRSIPAFERANDLNGLSAVFQRMGIISRELPGENALTEAYKYLQIALRYAEELQIGGAVAETDKIRRIGDALNGLGSVSIQLRQLDEAKRHLETADSYFTRLGDNSTRSSVARHLAEIARMQCRHKEAAALCDQAIKLARDARRNDRLGDALREMAHIEMLRNRKASCCRFAKEAKSVYQSIGAYADASEVDLLTVALNGAVSN